ncbi:MAG: NCS2 family permease [Firmicutes bacterium]|nr:NCS2 family permease [Bacillota bacterium]
MNTFKKLAYDFFQLKKHNTNIRKEFLAAVTNYFTIIYIVVLVPEILMEIFPGAVTSDGVFVNTSPVFADLNASQMFTALTAASLITAALGSFLMGFIVNKPFIQGPSLSISAFVTYTVCKGFGYNYGQALAIILISSVLFFILSLTGIEEKLHAALPKDVKLAASAGVGLFITTTGLMKAHIINFGDEGVKFITFSSMDYNTKTALLAIFGVVVIAIMLKKHIHAAIFIGKMVCIALALPLGLVHRANFDKFSDMLHPLSLAFKLDFTNIVDISNSSAFAKSLGILFVIIFSVTLMDIIETMTVYVAMHTITDTDKSADVNEKTMPRALETDAVTTFSGALLGTTGISTYTESIAGIVEGGRTGLTSVFTALFFLVSILFTPFVSLVPSAATATTLIVAGIIMASVVRDMDLSDITLAIPSMLTIIIMPLSNSVITGLATGIITYTAINTFTKRKVGAFMYATAFMCVVVLALMP